MVKRLIADGVLIRDGVVRREVEASLVAVKDAVTACGQVSPGLRQLLRMALAKRLERQL